MDNEFLANIQTEGEPFNFDSLQTESEKPETEAPKGETPAESLPDNKPTEEPAPSAEPKAEDTAEPEVKEDAKVFSAFHEHPRWKALQVELKELREKSNEYDSFKERVNPFIQKFEQPQTAPQWFQSLYGDNAEAWQQYQEAFKVEKKQIRDEILKELQPDLETLRETKQQKEVQDWANKQWSELGANPEVQKDLKGLNLTLDKVQGEISEVMSKYLPSDSEGNISLKASYELWKQLKKPEVKPSPIVAEKKKVAAISKSKEVEERDYRTSADFRGKSIHDLVE